jgi:GTPase SAR1 family protein
MEPEVQVQDDSIQPEPEQPVQDPPEPMKLVVVGACGVGKTTWISRLKSKNPRKYKMSKEDHEFPTVGAEVTTIEMPTSRATKKVPHNVTLKVWEVSGSDDQAGIRQTYYSGAHAGVILFKAASNSETTKAPLQTYWDVIRWQNELVQACGKDLPILVVRTSPVLSASRSLLIRCLANLCVEFTGPSLSTHADIDLGWCCADWCWSGSGGKVSSGEAG